MAKKQVAVSLRKPPPADPEAFVARSGPQHPEASNTVPANEARREPTGSLGPVVGTRVGERRELTVYLPIDLARELSIRCAELDRDVSNLVTEAVAKALSIEAPLEEPVAQVNTWTRVRGLLEPSRVRGLLDQFRERVPFPFNLA